MLPAQTAAACCMFTPFLGLAEQNILRCAEKELSGVIRTEFGGADGLRTHNGSFRRPGGLRLRVSVSDSLHTRHTSFKKICRAAHAPRYSRFAYGFGNRQEPNGRHCRSRKRDLYFLHGTNRALYCRKFRFRTANGSQLRYSAPAGHYGRERFARAAAAAGIAFHPSHRAMQCCKRKA